jgi:hypothetical protein
MERTHIPIELAPPTPTSQGCQDCLAEGHRDWVHVRLCQACGHVGCCDSSPRRHATAHHRATTHPLIRSFEPGEDWWWCHPDAIGSGFWFGDTVPEPAFHSYTAPEPPGLAADPLRPPVAAWVPQPGRTPGSAPLRAGQAFDDPEAGILEFFASAFAAGARLTGWPAALRP